MFKAVSKQPLSAVVFEQLCARIVSRELKAGDELPSEKVLCDLLQVNRGAVREAIKRLQQAGLVQVRHGGATTVLDYRAEAGPELLPSLLVDAQGRIQVEVARSIVRMRQVLSPEIAADAARRRDTATVERLNGLVAEMADCTETLRLQFLAFEFWDVMVDGSGNIAYRLAMNSLRKTYQPIANLLTKILGKGFHDLDSFRQLAGAVEAGDSETAFALAKRYIDASSLTINQLLDAYADTGLEEGVR